MKVREMIDRLRAFDPESSATDALFGGMLYYPILDRPSKPERSCSNCSWSFEGVEDYEIDWCRVCVHNSDSDHSGYTDEWERIEPVVEMKISPEQSADIQTNVKAFKDGVSKFHELKRRRQQLSDELKSAEKKFPIFPDDLVHRAAIICEEAGELIQAALDFYYGRCLTTDRMEKEAIQVGAMALRFLVNLESDEDEEKL